MPLLQCSPSRPTIVCMYDNELQVAIKAARKAGEIILAGYTVENKIDIKENKSQVTEVDKNSEAEIIKILESESTHKILAEETRKELENETTYWAVDPLDGTTNFIRRIPLLGVSIALIHEGNPVVGVMFNPITNDFFVAAQGQGATLNEQKIHCSTESSVVFATSGYGEDQKRKIAQFVVASSQFTSRKLGTTAFELSCLAKGAGDGFVAWGDELWDHAAGIILVREAGGKVTDWEGNDWRHPSNHVIASNGIMHDQLLGIVKTLS